MHSRNHPYSETTLILAWNFSMCLAWVKLYLTKYTLLRIDTRNITLLRSIVATTYTYIISTGGCGYTQTDAWIRHFLSGRIIMPLEEGHACLNYIYPKLVDFWPKVSTLVYLLFATKLRPNIPRFSSTLAFSLGITIGFSNSRI